MIEIVSLAGLTAFVVASFVVGTRILMLAARTHRLPETTIGASLFLAGGVGTAAMIAPQLFTSLGAETSYVLQQVGSFFSHVGYAWASIESFRYYAMSKKRLALGLADEEVVSRFFHWGLCTAAVVVIWISTAIQAVSGQSEGWIAATGLVTPLMGFVVAGSLWMAFFPKRREGAPASGVDRGEEQGA